MSHSSNSFQHTEILLKENFKLSSYEARAYISLLKLGRQNSKQIASSAGIPLPRVYDTLESLMEKGFAILQEDGVVAIPVKQALRGRFSQFEAQFSDEQKRRRAAEEEIIAEIQNSTSSSVNASASSSEISILKGFNAIANKFTEILEGSYDVTLVAKRAIEAREVFIPILLAWANGSERRKSIRIITPKNAKISKKELLEAKKVGAQIRRSENVIFDMMITDTNDVVIGVPDPLSDEINHAIAIWVHNTSFTSSTRLSIDEVWKSSRRI